MRIYLSSMAHPKRLAKRLAKSAGIPLSRAQHCCAAMFGYNDWHELEQVTAAQLNPPSTPDYLLSSEIVGTRRNVLGQRLYNALGPLTGGDWNDAWDLIDELDPTGSMPEEAIFVDRRLDDLFPRQWQLDLNNPEILLDVDIAPEVGFVAHVGMPICRAFESLLNDALAKGPSGSIQWAPRDDHGYRTFAFDFADRTPFQDMRDTAPSVAALPFRFVPTIQENILTGLELVIHPAAFASLYLTEEQVEMVVEAMIEYFRSTRLWTCSDWPACGSSSGIYLTLSGEIRTAPVLRIMERLVELLDDHQSMFVPDVDIDLDGKSFLPFREVITELDNQVSEEEFAEDFAAQHQEELVSDLVKEVVAMSRAPQMLAKLLTDRGFAQYAEFASSMSLETFDDWKKFGAFVRSMERAKTIPTDISIFFRNNLVDRVVASKEPAFDSPEFKAYADESDEKQAARYIDAAKRLGDEEMMKRYKDSDEAVMSLCFQVSLDLAELLDEFSQ